MSITPTQVVTLENLRAISRGRARGYGIALLVLSLLEILWYGGAASSLETTIQFGYNTAMVVPSLSGVVRVIVEILGVTGVVLLLGVGQVARVNSAPRGVRVTSWLVSIYLVIWPLMLWMGANRGGALRTVTIPVSTTGYCIGALTLAAGVALTWKRFDRGASGLFYGGLFVFLVGFLIWVARGSNLSGLDLQFTAILTAAVSAATCLIFGSLSGTLCERSGVVNIAIEGQFMAGAISSVMFASALNGTGISKTFAVLLAGLFGAFFGWILAVMALRYQADQVIVGVVLVAFCTAMTQFLMTQVLDSHQNLNQSFSLPVFAIPGLSRIPLVGPVLFDQNVLVYVAIGAVVVANVVLFRTRWGLRVRSVGEKPLASETVGVSVVRMRYGAVIVGGFVAGIGGAAFTLGPGSAFNYGMTSGYGYIALAIMIFGRWRPYGALMASLLFGFTISLSSNLNIYLDQLVIPQQLISALPYIITIAAVAGLVGRIRPPAADGEPFSRE